MHSYQSIIGPKLHSREFNNQQQEMMLGASILNRFARQLPGGLMASKGRVH
ncbi:hypothetical protein [Vibrio kanaloae]|uniref:hypothetical protein n=1 Tax=Vibrio kanaloae TaxID=170673 RepID=UPI0014836C08|nr:hypothetical protein [Vibrio kanaloae]